MSGLEIVERVDPDEAFTALSNETRIGILRALWDADGGMTFSELQDAVGTRDSGRFNYHLNELVGTFVVKSEDGYELARAGRRVNGAIEAGSYTVEATMDPITLDTLCSVCGGARTLSYADERVRVECESCPVTSQFAVPPSAFADYDRESIPRVAGRYLRTTLQHIDRGFCSYCDGRVESTVGSVADVGDVPDGFPDEFAEEAERVPLIRYECQRCDSTFTGGLGVILLSHPAVAGFYHDHGVDIRERSIWEFMALDTEHATVRSRDPFRASVTFEAGDDSLTVVVDSELDVLAIET